MKIKSLLQHPKRMGLIVLGLLLLSAVPYFVGPGLDNPEPLGKYLNNNFPSIVSQPQGLPYEPVFPNLTFDSPLTFNELPSSNRIIVGQRNGKIYWFDKSPDVAQKNMLIDLSSKVGVVWDGGFLGFTLHPEFGTAGNNYFYTYYTTKDGNGNDFPNRYTTQSCNSEEYWGNFLVLSRYELNPNTMQVNPSSEQVLLKLRMYGTTHRGGGLLFGDDGFLYLTTGDQTAFKKSQDIENNLDGGVLRLDVDKDPAKSHAPIRTMPEDHGYADEITGNGYWIPNDNPFLSPTGQNFEEYYSMGHRNPHRMTKDRETGDLYIGEIGGGRHEEINVVKKGKNFGWPLYEGLYRSTFCVSGLYNNMPHEEPLVAFPRSQANAVIGGYVYRGTEVPELKGKYVCADYGNGEEIWSVNISNGTYEQLGSFSSTNIISFGEDKQGELYILKQGSSTLYKMVTKLSFEETLPQALSQTGAFTDLTNLTPSQGIIPYDLVESFWSDGALKKRWIGIPNDGTHNTPEEQISYSENDDWDFPIGSVLIKHFELPINENNPSITKRLETRFSVKASDGNFYFATYKWNEAGTDAILLNSGLDEAINVTKADGSTESQIWRYPSREECATCHNSANGGVIGAATRYMNKNYSYPQTGRTANQLVTLSHIGILNEAINDSDTSTLLTHKSVNDQSATLNDRARSYLDLNCAYCHRSDSDVRAEFDLRLKYSLEETGLLTANPNSVFGLPDEKILNVGKPESSILYHRMNNLQPGVEMPLIGKNKLDEAGLALIEEWITQLDPNNNVTRVYNVTTTPSEIELEIGETFQVTANIEPSDAANQLVSWSTNDPTIATIDANGLVTAIGGGHVLVNVLTEDGGFQSSSLIKVNEPIVTISVYNVLVSPSTVELTVGETFQLSANVEPSNADDQKVNWISNDPSIATVDDNGLVTAVGNGEIDVTAISNDGGYQANVLVTVTGALPIINVYHVIVAPTLIDLNVGESQQLTATVEPSNATDQSVEWISNDTSIATVDANGMVTAVGKGEIDVTAITSDGGYQASATINVASETDEIDVYNVVVAPSTVSLNLGQSIQLSAAIEPENATNSNVSWISNDPSIAIIDDTGLVTGVGVGEIDVTVISEDGGYQASALITVGSQSSEITLYPNPSSGTVNIDLSAYTNKEVEIKLYNQNNQLLETNRVDQNHPNEVSLIFDEYPEGYYYLLFQSLDGWSTKAFILKY